jgi:hypothetical protein
VGLLQTTSVRFCSSSTRLCWARPRRSAPTSASQRPTGAIFPSVQSAVRRRGRRSLIGSLRRSNADGNACQASHFHIGDTAMAHVSRDLVCVPSGPCGLEVWLCWESICRDPEVSGVGIVVAIAAGCCGAGGAHSVVRFTDAEWRVGICFIALSDAFGVVRFVAEELRYRGRDAAEGFGARWRDDAGVLRGLNRTILSGRSGISQSTFLCVPRFGRFWDSARRNWRAAVLRRVRIYDVSGGAGG